MFNVLNIFTFITREKTLDKITKISSKLSTDEVLKRESQKNYYSKIKYSLVKCLENMFNKIE